LQNHFNRGGDDLADPDLGTASGWKQNKQI